MRKHQLDALELSEKNNYQSGIHFHATGTGKSWVALQLALNFSKKNSNCCIFWICEQKSILTEQFQPDVLKQKGFDICKQFLIFNYSEKKDQDWTSIVNSSTVWKKRTLVIINRAFLTSQKKYEKLTLPIHLVIHDECHSSSNSSTKKFYSWLKKKSPNTSCIGFSATPNLKHFPYQNLISKYSIYDAFCDNVILGPRIEWCNTILSNQEIGIFILNRIQELVYKKVIIWCGMIEQCYQLSQDWKSLFEGFTISVDTSESRQTNFQNMEDFYKAEKNAILFCACKHREGSDIPNLDGCIFLDKVQDRNSKTFIQCMGRVLRKDKLNKKQFGYILDLKASYAMDVIDRIYPYLYLPKNTFPWETKTVEVNKWNISQLQMVKQTKEDKKWDVEYSHLSNLFVRKVPSEPHYQERLEMELKMFETKNLIPYLLRALDVLKLNQSLPHITRGSCGSSLVCYLLGISHVDPVQYNITFARFLNEYRNTLPDIDFDFPYNTRKEVFLKLEQNYPSKVARISNHVHYHEKSALREAIRSVGIHQHIAKHEVKKFIKSLEPVIQEKIQKRKQELLETFRTYSLHCGGIVYYPDGVPNDLVLGETILKQIKLNREDVSKEKHFKIDILSSRALAVIHEIDKNVQFENPILDPYVFDMLSRGDNIGVILAETPLIRKAFFNVKPKSIEDIAICLSIIRPAAKHARNMEDVDEIKKELIYDDDAIMKISQLMKCSEADADKVRRYFSKNDKEKIQEFKQDLEKLDLPEEDKKHLLKCLKNLTKYSFCKAHAFSYAQLVYQLAYFKYHQPILFWQAVLKHCDSYYRKWVHKYEARISGVPYEVIHKPRDVSIYSLNRRNKIKTIQSPLEQVKRYGYWEVKDESFFPNCSFQLKDNEYHVQGIIASVRNIRNLLILHVGVAPKHYIELHITTDKMLHSKHSCVKAKCQLKDEKYSMFEANEYSFY